MILRSLVPTLFVGLFLCLIVAPTGANPIASSWGLHWAGPHNPAANTCALNVTNCVTSPQGELMIDAPEGPGQYDVYVLLMLTGGLKQTSFGICCDGSIEILGWTSCADFDTSSAGWPGCGEGNTVSWATQRTDFNVTLGIVEVKVNDTPAQLCICPDPRFGYAEWCDQWGPDLACQRETNPFFFGCIGFGSEGYNPCDVVPVEAGSWGAIKALYR